MAGNGASMDADMMVASSERESERKSALSRLLDGYASDDEGAERMAISVERGPDAYPDALGARAQLAASVAAQQLQLAGALRAAAMAAQAGGSLDLGSVAGEHGVSARLLQTALDAVAKSVREEAAARQQGGGEASPAADDGDAEDGLDHRPAADVRDSGAPETFTGRARYIPLRLTLTERKWLRLVEAALHVSEYTDKVDILSYASPAKRMVAQIREVCSILCGLVVSSDYTEGQRLIASKDFADNEDFFQRVFEIARRHKIMNPERMRDTYGKLMYLLMDSQIPEVKEMLGFSCVAPIRTVYRVLEQCRCLALLEDPLLATATGEVRSKGKPRGEVQRMIKAKEAAVRGLLRKYSHVSGSAIDSELLERCIYSIGDNNSYLGTARDPCDEMLALLRSHFNAERVTTEARSLAIRAGLEGARLSHDHCRQYAYVQQSLMLWREISHDMFRLWTLAEEDLLDEHNRYYLRDTGQGLNRRQSAPRVARAMSEALAKAKRSLGSWVGSSMVHLGDDNVPNALMFIDKYAQVSRILNPVSLCIGRLPELEEQPELKSYVDSAFHGVAEARIAILRDFFRHAFDGSGADNFYDAGSCIDGRLTSAWNWCSLVEKKPYFPLMLLTGFVGFDGRF